MLVLVFEYLLDGVEVGDEGRVVEVSGLVRKIKAEVVGDSVGGNIDNVRNEVLQELMSVIGDEIQHIYKVDQK